MTDIEHETQEVTTQTAIVTHQAPQQSGGLLKSIESLSKMKDLTPEKMDQIERLFAMQQKMVDREAEQTFNIALAAAQAEIEPVAANKRNSHTSSTFADLSAIHSACKPIWTKHGFSVLTKVGASTKPEHIRVYGNLRHTSGHSEPFDHDWPMDTDGAKGNANKTPIQGMGSTSQYARRYTECMLFDIAIGRDNDGNVDSGERKEPELSTKAADWIAAIQASATVDECQKQFTDGFKDLTALKDNYGKNQLIKAKDKRKKELSNASAN